MGWLDDAEQSVANTIDGAVDGAKAVLGFGSDTPKQTPSAPTTPVTPEDAATFAAKVQQQTQQAQQLKAAANAGNFSISQEAGQAMIKAFQNAQDKWLTNRTNVVKVADKYMLGSTPGAKVIAAWNQQVGQQLVTAYDQLNGIYQAQIDAYTQAMKNYEGTEQTNKKSVSE